MRIFITGGTGFVGAHLCRALAGHQLMVLSRDPTKLRLPFQWQALRGDLADSLSWQRELAAFEPDVCVHLAWSGLPDYSLANNTKNFAAGLSLFENLLAIRCKRVVVTGTCFEYGDLTGCLSENEVPAKQGLFAAFKSSQRLIAQSMFASSGLSFVWARPFFIYGPNQRASSLIPSTVQSICEGKRPDIRTPDAIQDFVYVHDVANVLARLATTNIPPGTYNVGSGRPMPVRNLVNIIASTLGKPDVYSSACAVGPGFWAEMKHTRMFIPDLALTSIEQGIKETVAFLRNSTKCAA